MKPTTPTIFVIVASALACDPVSRNVGDLQAGSEGIDLVAAADAYCQAQEDCCSADVLAATGLWHPSLCRSMKRDELEGLAEQAADRGLQADPACFELDDICGSGDACAPPCKLFFGTKAVDEPCEGDSFLDDCAQGLFCQSYAYHEWICDDGVSLCGGYENRCVDPCATSIEVECNAFDWPSTCGPEAYCDDPWWSEDEVAGICRARTALGTACDPGFDSCLPEAFCDEAAPGGPTCVATLVDGTPCDGDRTCASRRCGASDDPDVQIGVCEAALAAVCE